MNFSPSPEDLESTSCPICGPGPASTIRYYFDPYRIVCCSRCGLIFLSPRLTELAILRLYSDQEYYISEIAGRGYDEYLEVKHNWIKTFTRRLAQITKFQGPGKCLDIGCGPGFFLEAAQARGYDVFGLDPSDYIVKIAREIFGDRIQRGLIESADYPSENFDLVVAFDTFEHVYHPLEWLMAVRRALKTGGLIAITTPDQSSYLARISGKNWVSFKLPEHVFYWTPETLRQVLTDGWEIMEIQRAGQYASLSFLFRRLLHLPANPRGLVKSLLDLLGKINIYSDNGSVTVIAKKISK
jgi:SAM-dependent methyltransferase